MFHHQWKGALCRCRGMAGGRVINHLQSWNLTAFGQGKADETGNNEQIDRKQFQDGSEDTTPSGDLFIGCAERALDNVLVGTTSTKGR